MEHPPEKKKSRPGSFPGISLISNDISRKFLNRSDLARLLRMFSGSFKDQSLILAELDNFFISDPQAKIKLVFVEDSIIVKNIFIMSSAMQELAQKFPENLYVDLLKNVSPGFNLYSVSCEDDNSGWKVCANCISKTNNSDTLRFLVFSVLQSMPKMKAQIKCVTIHPAITDPLDMGTLLPNITMRHCILLIVQILEHKIFHLDFAVQAQIKTILHILLHTRSLKVYNRHLNDLRAICPAEIFQYYFETWHPSRKLWCTKDNKRLKAEKSIYTYVTSLHYTLAAEMGASLSLNDCLRVVLNDTRELKNVPEVVPVLDSLSVPDIPSTDSQQICEESEKNGLERTEFHSWEEFQSFLDTWCEEQKTIFVIRHSVPLTDEDMSYDLIQSLKYSSVNLGCSSFTSCEKIDCPASVILRLGPKKDRLVIIEANLVHNHKLSELEFSHYFKRQQLETSTGLPIRITNSVSKRFLSREEVWNLEDYSKANDQSMCDLLKEFDSLFKNDPGAKVKLVFQEDVAVLNSIFISTSHMGNLVQSFPRVLYMDKVVSINEEFELYTVLCQDANGRGRECAYCVARNGTPDLIVFIVASLVQSVPTIKFQVKCITVGANITDVDSVEEVLPCSRIQICQAQVLETIHNKAKELRIPKLEKIKELLRGLAYSDSATAYSQILSGLEDVFPLNFLQYYLETWHQNKGMWVKCWTFEKQRECHFMEHMTFHIEKLNSVMAPPLTLSVCLRGLLDLQVLKTEMVGFNQDEITTLYRSVSSPQSACQIEEELGLATHGIYDIKETADGFSLDGGICSFKVNREVTSCTCSIYTSSFLPCRHLFSARLWTGQSLFDAGLIEHGSTKSFNVKPSS